MLDVPHARAFLVGGDRLDSRTTSRCVAALLWPLLDLDATGRAFLQVPKRYDVALNGQSPVLVPSTHGANGDLVGYRLHLGSLLVSLHRLKHRRLLQNLPLA